VTEQFWCPIPDCNRSESYGGQKRPFSRKDKLNSHVRNIHQAATGPHGSSAFHAACTSEAVDTIDLASFEGCANDSRSTAIIGLPSGPDSTESIYIHGHIGISGFTSVGELSSADGLACVNEITWIDEFTNVGGLSSVDGFASANELTGMDGFPRVNGLSGVNEFAGINEITGIDGFTNVGGLSSVDGFAGVDELIGMDRFTSDNEITGIAVPDVYDYDTIDIITSYDELGWLAGDSTFIQ